MVPAAIDKPGDRGDPPAREERGTQADQALKRTLRRSISGNDA
jgi:hypothetical protein